MESTIDCKRLKGRLRLSTKRKKTQYNIKKYNRARKVDLPCVTKDILDLGRSSGDRLLIAPENIVNELHTSLENVTPPSHHPEPEILDLPTCSSTTTLPFTPEDVGIDTSTKPEFNLCGRRIVDLKHFFQEIVNFKHHSLFSCNAENLKIFNEKRIGLISKFYIKCSMCQVKKVISTDVDSDHNMDINKASVLGTISTGGGYSQLEEFLAFCNIPSMSFPTFSSAQDSISSAIHNSAYSIMIEAGKEEAKLAKDVGDVDNDGIPKIKVIADGAWCKRSYRSNYNASSGVGVIIGQRTKKILYLGIKNKYCFICARAENKKEEANAHTCFKNWNKPSTAMESEIILEGFKSSVQMHGLKYAYLVGDGDSSVTRKLADVRPYGNLTVHKIECRNHLLRNFGNHLRELSTKRVSGKRLIVSVKERESLKSNLNRFRVAVQCAVSYRINEQGSHEEQVEKLRKDILNSVYHIFGNHSKCADYFCKAQNVPNEDDLIDRMKVSGLLQDIEVHLNRLVQHADSLLLDMDNNSAECYNSVVAKFIGGKRINFSGRQSYQLRCEAASVSFNVGSHEYPRIINKAITTKSPSGFTKKYVERKSKTCGNLKVRKELFPKKQKRKYQSNTGADKDYGPEASKTQSPLPENYDIKKEQFLASLQRTDNEIAELERRTRGQSSNQLWRDERYKRLTASNFGRICRMRKLTTCQATVQSLLYSKFTGSAATDWGTTHERLAISEFEEKFDVTVRPAGLLIDAKHGFLGASVDGFVNENAIVEVKCPHKFSNFSPQDGVNKNELKHWTLEDNSLHLKKTSHYYYQVQGQLHISNREFCYFVVWSPHGMEVEKIYRDRHFWSNQMESLLIDFYVKCLLPEIIDPQHPKGLLIRELRERTFLVKRINPTTSLLESAA